MSEAWVSFTIQEGRQMGEFPEKIWAIEKGYPSLYRVSCSVLEHEPDEATEYVRADLYAALEEKLAEARKALEWQPIETVPLNTIVDLWCTYADAPASWGNDRPAGHIVHNRHKSKEYGWFGNESNDGIPQANGPDLVPVAWRWPVPEIPMEMMERFVAARVRAKDNAKTLIDAVSEEVWSHDASQDNCNVIDKDGLT